MAGQTSCVSWKRMESADSIPIKSGRDGLVPLSETGQGTQDLATLLIRKSSVVVCPFHPLGVTGSCNICRLNLVALCDSVRKLSSS